MYNREYGLLQSIFGALGFPKMQFLNSANEQLFWLVFPAMIMVGPGLIYITTLQSIPRSLYEAAEVEGASVWRKIWTVSIPRIRPMIAMLLTFALIENLQAYDWPALMTGGGGPGGTARTMVMYMLTFVPLHMGTGTAVAVLLFAIIMTVVLIFRTVFKEDPDV
jgi:multiple sugar transport system permease protein